MRTPAQRRNLLILRDEILPGIEEGELRMRAFFYRCGTPSCLAGHAFASGAFPGIRIHTGLFSARVVKGLHVVFGLSFDEWYHIFGVNLPNDPTWLAANITDLLCAEE